MKIGDKVRYLRVQNDLTQKELAEKIGIKQNTLSDYERNLITISVNLIDKLSEIFSVEKSYFLDEENPKDIDKDIKKGLVTYGLMDYLIENDIITDPENIDDQTKEIILAAVKKDLFNKMKKQP